MRNDSVLNDILYSDIPNLTQVSVFHRAKQSNSQTHNTIHTMNLRAVVPLTSVSCSSLIQERVVVVVYAYLSVAIFSPI